MSKVLRPRSRNQECRTGLPSDDDQGMTSNGEVKCRCQRSRVECKSSGAGGQGCVSLVITHGSCIIPPQLLNYFLIMCHNLHLNTDNISCLPLFHVNLIQDVRTCFQINLKSVAISAELEEK